MQYSRAVTALLSPRSIGVRLDPEPVGSVTMKLPIRLPAAQAAFKVTSS